MTEFVAVREIEGDLRQVIVEASSRKTIPHVRDRAERAVASILMITDADSLVVAIEEVLSTLLIATEVGLYPKLIILSLSILQKLAASNAIQGATFLHMITVLCKSASSLSGVLAGPSGASMQTEVEIAQLRCLQTLHLLQVKDLGPLFLDEIALSQVIGMCVNLVNNPTSSSVVIQSAQGAISQLYLFVLDLTWDQFRNDEAGDSTRLDFEPEISSGGEIKGVIDFVLKTLSRPQLKPLLAYVHDLVTISSPSFTRHVACSLFGSGRIKPQLCIEMLSLTFTSPQTRWIPGLVVIVKHYLFPLISKTVAEYLEISQGSESSISLSHFRLIMRLYVTVVKTESLSSQLSDPIDSLLVQLNNFLIQEPGLGDPFNRVIVTELCTVSIASCPFILNPSIARPHTMNALGGDSPVRRVYNTAEGIVESVCMHLHSLGGEIANAKFSLLFSSSEFSSDISSGDQGSVSLDLVLTVISAAVRLDQDTLVPTIAHTWTAILSCLVLVISQSSAGPSQQVLNGLERFLVLLAKSNHKEGLHASVTSVLKLPATPSMNKFILNMFHRISENDALLTNIGTTLWRQILKQFEIISSGSNYMSSDDLTVQNIALDTFFHSPASVGAVHTFVEALLGDRAGVSQWTFHRVGQLLTSPLSLDHCALWKQYIDPLFFDECPSVQGAFHLVQTIVCQYPQDQVACKALGSAERITSIQPHVPLACMLGIVENCGYLLNSDCWASIVSITLQTLPNPKALRLAEMAIEDITEYIEPELPRLVDILSLTALGIQGESLSAASAFKAVGLALKAAEHVKNDHPETWKAIDEFFLKACTDRRAEVRNCALKTLVNVPFPASSSVVVNIGFSVVEAARSVKDSNPGSPSSKPAGVAIIHHSRDTEEKRWSESMVLALAAVTRRFHHEHKDKVARIFALVIIEEGVTDEVLNAACKACVDIWKSLKFAPEALFLSILESESNKIRSDPFRIGRIPPVLTPLLMNSLKSVTSLDPLVENSVFKFLAATVTCPSLHEETAIAFSTLSPATSVWSSPGWTPVEVEAFRPAVEWTVEEGSYKPVVASKTVPSYVWSVFQALHVFTDEHVVELFLNEEVLFVNSLTTQLAARAMAAIEIDSRVLASTTVNALERIAKTRTVSIGVASTGLWKQAVQVLVKKNAYESLFRLLRQINSEDPDLIDYLLAITCVNSELGHSLLISFINKELGGESNKYRDFLLFAVLTAVLGDRETVDANRMHELFTLTTRENDEGVTSVMNKIVIKSELPPEIVDSVIGYMRTLLSQQDVASVCSLLNLLSNRSELRTDVQKMLVSRVWDALAGTLVICDSGEIRESLATLLVDIGPPYS
jgi:hypothetical protein